MVAQGHLLKEHPVGAALWSGGTTGPEGSVLVFGLMVVMVVLMWCGGASGGRSRLRGWGGGGGNGWILMTRRVGRD